MGVIRPALTFLGCLLLLGQAPPDSQEPEPQVRPLVWYVCLEAREGRNFEARDHCRRTVQYLKANYQGAEGGVYTVYHETRPVTLHRFIEAPSLEVMRAIWSAEDNDDGFKPLAANLDGVTVPSTGLDLLLLPTGPRPEGTSSMRVLRTARARFGHMGAALRIAEELRAYWEESCPGLHVRTLVQDAGDVLTLHWAIDFDALDVWHDALFRMLRDPAYETILERAGQVFLEESVQDVLMEDRIG